MNNEYPETMKAQEKMLHDQKKEIERLKEEIKVQKDIFKCVKHDYEKIFDAWKIIKKINNDSMLVIVLINDAIKRGIISKVDSDLLLEMM